MISYEAMKKWIIGDSTSDKNEDLLVKDIIARLLLVRGLTDKTDIEFFLVPPNPVVLTSKDVEIDKKSLGSAVRRIQKAIEGKESVVVYADYDADGITAGAIMWETLWKLGARVMPYIPHRAEEGYGLSTKGIDAVREQYDPSLIITVDHGITAADKVAYAKKLGIDVIVTDHHVQPKKVPDCLIVHTTKLAGSGVSWFVAKEVALASKNEKAIENVHDLLALAAMGTIADLVPLIGPNRAIAKYGLMAMRKTHRVGLNALMSDAGIDKTAIETYTISHMLAPRLNAMGRLEHALDALRLLCTNDSAKATLLAQKLGLTNKERQQLTEDSVIHAHTILPDTSKKLIFIAHESYNQGIIGLIAGRLTEEFYRPTIVVAVGEEFSKASARSIHGFNIIDAIRTSSDLLVDAGGHPMAAGFTVLTKNLPKLQKNLEEYVGSTLTDDLLERVLKIDMEISLTAVTESLWSGIQQFAPFGIGNMEPVFASRGLLVREARLIGATKKHLKFKVRTQGVSEDIDAIAFNMAGELAKLSPDKPVDMAYAIDMNEWNGRRKLQLKVKDIT